jgi:hypothetical protein
MSLGRAIYGTSFAGANGSHDYCCCEVGCMWWVCCFPFAKYRELTRNGVKGQFIADLENESERLCWACTVYFASDEQRAYPLHYSEKE